MTLRGLGWKRNGRFRTWANNPALENVPSVSAPLPHKSSHRLPRQCLDSSLDHGENASRVPAENVPHLSPLPFFPPPQGGKPSRRCYSGRACRLPKTTQDGVFPLALIGIIAVRNLSKTLSLPNGDSALDGTPRRTAFGEVARPDWRCRTWRAFGNPKRAGRESRLASKGGIEIPHSRLRHSTAHSPIAGILLDSRLP